MLRKSAAGVATFVAVLLAVGTLTASAAGAVPIATAAGQWQAAERPQPVEPTGGLGMVSCSSKNACVAIGQGIDRAGRYRYITERWNGNDWASAGLPRPPVPTVDLSCAAAIDCAAIAYTDFGQQPLVERLTASGWATEELPLPDDSSSVSYLGVGCPSVHRCVAVGRAYRPNHSVYGVAALWDGHGWESSPLPDIGLRDLTAVSCGAPGSCLAIGTVRNPASDGHPADVVPRAVQLAGGQWQPTTQLAFPSPYLTINDVSCSAPDACSAVGTHRACPQGRCTRSATLLAERWDGTTWAAQTVPQGNGKNQSLDNISCGSATLCAATTRQNYAAGPAVLTWDGTDWTQHNVPHPDSQSFGIGDVACSGATCQTVGGYYPRVGLERMLVRPFDVDAGGAVQFRTVPVYEPPGRSSYTLQDVSCPSTVSCVAVGTVATEAGADALYLARWDGAGWTDEIVSVATATVTGPVVSAAVSCSAPGQCMVAGVEAHDGTGLGSAFTVQLDGDTETVRSLGTGTSASRADVSCTASDACTAAIDVVDCRQTFSCGHLPDFERWDGTNWQQQTPAAQLDTSNPDGVTAVSCGSATGCVAIGFHNAQVWNGSRWRAEEVPAAQGNFAAPTDVSCTAARTCMVVGANPRDSNYAVRLTGQGWTVLSIDDLSSRPAFAVSCSTAKACSAVGSGPYYDGVPPGAARWNGTTWTTQGLPAASGNVVAVSCVAADTCMAVGMNTVITEGF